MGSSRADKAATHERIVQTAADRFRELGVDGIGLAALMQEVGLTHGGFYRHFGSREDLVAAGVQRALENGASGVAVALAKYPVPTPALLMALVDWYLSKAHRDQLATSCAVTSLASDVARSNDQARAAYTRQVESYLEVFVYLMVGATPKKAKRAKAIAAWSMLVGALSMARAVNDEALSDEILETAASAVRRQLA